MHTSSTAAHDHVLANEILERRRLRRRLFIWRLAGVALAILVGVLLVNQFGKHTSAAGNIIGSATGGGAPYIARYKVEGMIFSDLDRDHLLEKIADNNNAKALVVHINSPGGTTAGSEALYESLRIVSAKKPVVAVMSELAASGGYIAAIGADYIIARGNTITASIGVIAQSPQFGELMEKVGVEMLEVRSGSLKAKPSPFSTDLDPESITATQNMVDDSFKWFLGLVKERRSLSTTAESFVRTGRVVTGRQALKLGLIDELGAEREAVNWLVTQKQIPKGLKLVDIDTQDEKVPFISLLMDEFFSKADKKIVQRVQSVTMMPLMSMQK